MKNSKINEKLIKSVMIKRKWTLINDSIINEMQVMKVKYVLWIKMLH